MSLDIWLGAPEKCPHCGGSLPAVRDGSSQNYTHNVTPMWHKAGVYDALYMSDGQLVTEQYLAVLRAGIEDMKAKPEAYRELNPPNGWGKYESALGFLEKWYDKCANQLGAQIGVSK